MRSGEQVVLVDIMVDHPIGVAGGSNPLEDVRAIWRFFVQVVVFCRPWGEREGMGEDQRPGEHSEEFDRRVPRASRKFIEARKHQDSDGDTVRAHLNIYYYACWR